MRKYEIMFIIHPSLDEERIKATVEKYENVINTDGSKILEVKDWGLRELAYEINKVKKGYYMIFNIEASNDVIVEFERLALIDSNIVRHIIIKNEK